MSENKTKTAATKGARSASKETKSGPKSIPPKAGKSGSKSKAGKAGAAAKGAPKAPVSVRAATGSASAPTEVHKEHGFRRKIIGRVVGDKMLKTVVVEVIRKAMHPMYKKYVRVRNKYKAHDENNVYKIGDTVEIMEHRPISKNKRWLVTRLVSRPVEA